MKNKILPIRRTNGLKIDSKDLCLMLRFEDSDFNKSIIDYTNVTMYSSYIFKFIKSIPEMKYLILDLTNVGVIDSSGVGLFIHIKNDLKERELLLINVPTCFTNILNMIELNGYFNVQDSLQEAEKYIEQKEKFYEA